MATVVFDAPDGEELDTQVSGADGLRRALLGLQRRYGDLSVLADVIVPNQDRMSVVLSGNRGMVVLWADTELRTLGDPTARGTIPVWDGAGVDMSEKYFIPIEQVLSVVEQWMTSGTRSPAVRWTSGGSAA